MEGNYSDGKRNGIWRFWDYNGNLRVTREYKDDSLIQDSNKWNDEVMLKDGNQNLKISWYKNGNISSQGKKIRYKEDGEWIYWYKDGMLMKKCNFKDSKLDGYFVEYFPNGKVASEFNYKNGKQEGHNKTYFISGELLSDINTVNGAQVGKSLRWYRWEREKDGNLTEINYVDTLGNGYCIEWDNRHQKRSEGNYKNWQRDGIWTYYPYKNKALYENGRWVKQIIENK